MTPLKIPLQVSCPNCQAANLPGSPYCSRCGAPLADVTPGAAASRQQVTTAHVEDPVKRFVNDGQDPTLVRQAYDRALSIMTTGETIEYIGMGGRGSIGHTPDCAVVTSKRLLLYRKKMLGKIELDDCFWRDVRDATMKDGRNGVSFTLSAIQGWQLTVEGLPKVQAWRLYEVAVQLSDRLHDGAHLPYSSAPEEAAPAFNSRATGGLPSPGSIVGGAPVPVAQSRAQAAPQRPSPAHLTGSAATGSPDAQGAGAQGESASAQVTQSFVPTPQSVLQNILQQSQAASNGAPTRPMQFPAAAFQAPAAAEAQPVVIREGDTEPNMRSAPAMPTLEQISVFSGPLSFQHGSPNEQSAPLNRYPTPTPVYSPPVGGGPASGPMPRQPLPKPLDRSSQPAERPTNGSDVPGSAQERQSHITHADEDNTYPEEVFGALPSEFLRGKPTEADVRHTASSGTNGAGPAQKGAGETGNRRPAALPVRPQRLPMPGSMASGPLLAPADDSAIVNSGQSNETGSLATQRLYQEGQPASDVDRPTDINLGQYGLPTSNLSAEPKGVPAQRGSSKSTVTRSGAPSSRSPQRSNGDDPINKMKQLRMLLESGLITEEDYEAKKADVLARFF